ncbi:MAG TPA: amylo-alpha-1,6-glucosidase [Polyangiaceae bacterium]|nr:amylo-alpha-1,6-glucosidase [Polyangiaceae bacterium]
MIDPSNNQTALEEDHHIAGSSSHETAGGRVLKHGDAFIIVDRLGEIHTSGRGEQGLFYRGTRYISKLRFRFGKRSPMLLCSSVLENNLLLAVDLANPDMPNGNGRVPHGTIHVSRRALLDGATYVERISILNYGVGPVRFPLRIELDADFADIFEVRGARRAQRGELLPAELGASSLRLAYEGLDRRTRSTEFAFSERPSSIAAGEVVFDLELEPHQKFSLDLTVTCGLGPAAPQATVEFEPAMRNAAAALRDEESDRTIVHTSNPHFNRWLARSRADLRMLATQTPHGLYPYAGVPWFSTVFGRDGIWTALQMLWLEPAFAAGVLAFLSASQATELDAEADAEPGKIVHEMRDGEMAVLREVPFGRYYGSIDSTPLYLMLAAAYYERTGDLSLIRRIWPNLMRAVEWMDRHGDSDGDGFIEYGKRSSNGLVQQGWKDSNDSVFHRDGVAADGTIALCEVQGYAYAARRGMALLGRALGYDDLVRTWSAQADDLRQRFDRAFWCDELDTYALALDGRKQPCRVRSSNAGHCLYTRIALPERHAPLAKQLMSKEMFSGWGVRTLATDERRFNPMSYHNGSVWPHDNAIIAEGLAKVGYRWEAAALLEGFFDAASFMDFQRLPELFCGFPRQPGQEPIRYPVACLPQAWASGASFSLLNAVLGVELDANSRRLTLRNPVLPAFIDWLEIRRLLVGTARVDVRLVRYPEDVGVTVLNPSSGVEVIIIK